MRYDNESFEAKFQTALPYSMPAKRLFALGLDAYQVAEDWAHGRKAFEISGETGQLTVHRDLSAQVVLTPASFEEKWSLTWERLNPSSPKCFRKTTRRRTAIFK